MTSVISIICEDRKSILMGCDSLITFGDYFSSRKEDKIYHVGKFLVGMSGSSEPIIEALREFENYNPIKIKNVYSKLVKFNKDKGADNEDYVIDFLISGVDRGKMAIYNNDCCDVPAYTYNFIGVGGDNLQYALFDDCYRPEMNLNQGILLLLSGLNYLEKQVSVERPFHIHYIKGAGMEPEKLDERIVNEFQELIDEKKQKISMIDKDLNERVKEIKF